MTFTYADGGVPPQTRGLLEGIIIDDDAVIRANFSFRKGFKRCGGIIITETVPLQEKFVENAYRRMSEYTGLEEMRRNVRAIGLLDKKSAEKKACEEGTTVRPDHYLFGVEFYTWDQASRGTGD